MPWFLILLPLLGDWRQNVPPLEQETPYLATIDYTQPSSAKRLTIWNRQTHSILLQTRVSHGQGSGKLYAHCFSNHEGSHQSSLGLFRIGARYHGRHGLSIKLDGLTPGMNDQASKRHLVIHAADYASPAFLKKHGYLGRSWGCPAVDADDLSAIAHLLPTGSLLMIHGQQDASCASAKKTMAEDKAATN